MIVLPIVIVKIVNIVIIGHTAIMAAPENRGEKWWEKLSERLKIMTQRSY